MCHMPPACLMFVPRFLRRLPFVLAACFLLASFMAFDWRWRCQFFEKPRLPFAWYLAFVASRRNQLGTILLCFFFFSFFSFHFLFEKILYQKCCIPYGWRDLPHTGALEYKEFLCTAKLLYKLYNSCNTAFTNKLEKLFDWKWFGSAFLCLV